jgi:hypothetical protein
MIRASEIAIAADCRLTTTVPVWQSHNRTTASWFDAGDPGSMTSITGDLSVASRGLSVEEHTTRIMMHLQGERDTLA